MSLQKSIFGPKWGARIQQFGLKIATMAGYDAGRPSRTFPQHTRLGTNPNSTMSQIERVRMEWNAEWLAKNSALGIGYIRQRMNYCSPLGWMPDCGDDTLNGELRAYIDGWMEDGGMNCSAYDAFSRIGNVELPVRGDAALVWLRDESRLRIQEAGGDQIGELNVFGNPSYSSKTSLSYFAGMYFDNGIVAGFRIYNKGTNDYYHTPCDYSAGEVLYFQDNLFKAIRGVTIFHGTIKTLSKSEQLFQFGMDAAQKQAKTGVVVRNNSGGPIGDYQYETQQTDDGVIYIERAFDGAQTQYQYTGDSYEVIKTDAPGDAIIEGCNYADEKSCLSLGMPFSFLVNARDIGGAPSRLEISKAQKEVERIRRKLTAPFKRMIYVIVMDAIDRGIFNGQAIRGFTADQLTCGQPKFPNLPTADAFRETQDDIASNRAGIETRSSILSRTNEDWREVLKGNTREAIDISRAVQDANRALQKTVSAIDGLPYEGDITAADIAQNSDNPQQSAAAELMPGMPPMAPGIRSSGKQQVTDNPPNVTQGAFAGWDESQHPRADDGKFGEASGSAKKASKSASRLNTAEAHTSAAAAHRDAAEKATKPEDRLHHEKLASNHEAIAKIKSDSSKLISGMKNDLADVSKGLPDNSDLKAKVDAIRAKVQAVESKTANIEHALKTEDTASELHGEGSPEHKAAQQRTKYVAQMSAYIGDVLASELPSSTQDDIAKILGTNGQTPSLKLIKYGMVAGELEKMADPHNLESAQRHIRNTPNYACADEVHENSEKYVLINNGRVVDGHHFLAKALKGSVTKSLPVIDLTPARFQVSP